MPDDLKAALIFDIRFALRLRLVDREARKAVRDLSERAIDNMAEAIAAHLLLAGWHHRPRSETDFSGPGLMSGPKPEKPWPRGEGGE